MPEVELSAGTIGDGGGPLVSDRSKTLSILRMLLAFSITSTALHFTHNFVKIDQYPDDLIDGTVVQVAILLTWPALTAIGLLGYRLYARGRYSDAHMCLLAYSFLGISTLGHFLDGSPDIAPFWYATIFTDGLAGFAMAAFVAWSWRLTAASAQASGRSFAHGRARSS
jgi:hypothetical protein